MPRRAGPGTISYFFDEFRQYIAVINILCTLLYVFYIRLKWGDGYEALWRVYMWN